MSPYFRAVLALLAIGLLIFATTGCNSGSKDSKSPADKMEKMDSKMENMKMDEKAK